MYMLNQFLNKVSTVTSPVEVPTTTLEAPTQDIEPSVELQQPQTSATTLISAPHDLDSITEKILFHKQQAEHSFIEMGKLLIEARKELPHGHWLTWLRSNIEISPVTAQRLMRLAEEFSNASPVTHLGFTKASILLGLPKEERDAFLEESHEVNGVKKSVEDMSKRELEEVVRIRKKSRAKTPKAKSSCNYIFKPQGRSVIDRVPHVNAPPEPEIPSMTTSDFKVHLEGLLGYLDETNFDISEHASELQTLSDKLLEVLSLHFHRK